jgi:NTP pyrophosphatase (non-canonical NTP hydrolase)
VITADEYQEWVGDFDTHEGWFKPEAYVFGLTAEAGEVAGAFEKATRIGRELDVDNVKLELGDVLWNVARLAANYGWTLSEIMQANIDKLTARYAEQNIPTGGGA